MTPLHQAFGTSQPRDGSAHAAGHGRAPQCVHCHSPPDGMPPRGSPSAHHDGRRHARQGQPRRSRSRAAEPAPAGSGDLSQTHQESGTGASLQQAGGREHAETPHGDRDERLGSPRVVVPDRRRPPSSNLTPSCQQTSACRQTRSRHRGRCVQGSREPVMKTACESPGSSVRLGNPLNPDGKNVLHGPAARSRRVACERESCHGSGHSECRETPRRTSDLRRVRASMPTPLPHPV